MVGLERARVHRHHSSLARRDLLAVGRGVQLAAGRDRQLSVRLVQRVADASRVSELQEDAAFAVVHGLGHRLPRLHLVLAEDARRAERASRRRCDVGGLRDDQTAASRALRVVGDRERRLRALFARAQTRTTRVCAIDPGVRNFVTVYDPDGRTFSVSDARSVIEYRFKRVDALKSKFGALAEKKIFQTSTKTNATAETTSRTEPLLLRQRYRLRRKIRFTLRRITRMICDMHHKVSSWLSANYHEVLLPAFQILEMARKYKQSAATDAAAAVRPAGARRKLSSPSVRAMMALSHFWSKNLLKYKMERSGGRVIECCEEYTSKTCSRCGNVKYDLGASAIYKCNSCRLTQDRDIHAAKNIFIKNVSRLVG